MTDRHALAGWLGAGAQWVGDLTFEGRMRIDGTFRGRIYSEDLLEIGPAGLVEGQVDVAEAIVAGTIDGKARVRRRLVVAPTGFILGDLEVGHMEVQPGGAVRAHVVRIKPER